ncbi:MAG: ribosome silencing factor, partial [Candidatus Omnitrophica bacterium]|nr:ribosome silencing factor [Candidatus Omnitrophota bacterium]
MPYRGHRIRKDITPEKKENVLLIAKLAQSKKAQDLVILDMRGLVGYTDYFVICSASSTRTAKTIADTILDFIAKSKLKQWHIEGYKEGDWILIDLGGIIVHIFQVKKR